MADLSPELLTELNDAIANRHLESVADVIRDNACECYAMVATGEDDYLSDGNTRFGGNPDLPETMWWPSDPEIRKSSFSNFVAQINFAELPPLASEHAIPRSGILYLFVRCMESAAEPVLLDALLYDGDMATLQRRPAPPTESLCDKYLVDLVPQVIKAVPSISLASFRDAFLQQVDEITKEVAGQGGDLRRCYMQADLKRQGQIGQVFGFANAGDELTNLYRQVVLGRLGKRRLMYIDHWTSIEEYDAYIETRRNNRYLEEKRDGVVWLSSNREMISALVDEWRLLFRLDSNSQMGLNINDADPLYVFIRHDDLAKRNFSNLAGEVTQG